MPIARFYPESGGVSRQAFKLGGELARRVGEVHVLTRHHPGSPRTECVGGMRVHRTSGMIGNRDSAGSYVLHGLQWLIRNRARYQVMHCHQALSPGILGGLVRWLFRDKRALVKISTSGPLSEAKTIASSRTASLRLRLLKRIDRVVVLNREMEEEFGRLGYPANRIVHIPNGVEIPVSASFDSRVRQEHRNRLGLEASRVVLYVGRLSAEKRLDVLLHAWHRFARADRDLLCLVGEGGAYRNVEAGVRQLAAELGLDATVRFCGRQDEVLPYYLGCDVFVLPSETEGMSNSLLEAMAAGAAVVATDIPGNSILIDSEKQGVLVPAGDADSLSSALERLLEDRTLAQQMGRAARERVACECSIERVAARYLHLYREMFESPSAHAC